MSVFALDQKGQKAIAEEASLNLLDASHIEASTFSGVAKGAGMGLMKGGVRAGQLVGMAAATVPMVIDRVAGGDNMTGETLTDRYFGLLDEKVNRAADYWTPGHAEVGKAGQVLGGLSEIVLPMMVGGGNPVATATMVAGSQTAGTGVDLVNQGVDGKTAGVAATVQGASAYAGFKIPFLGSSLATRMASGVVGNVVTNAGAAAVQNKILTGAGYDEQAKQFDPANMEARAIDLLTGVVFGGFSHLAARRQIKPSDVDAVLTANNAKHFQSDTAPGAPASASSSAAHQSAMETALEQLAKGDPVSLGEAITSAEFVRRPESFSRDVVRSELPPDMRWAPSERLAQIASEQRRALRYDAPELNEYAALIEQRYGLPGGLINALKNAGEKSNSTQISPAGASGVMQFMPENLRKYGVADATDPVQMIDAAGRYLRDTMRQYGGNVDAVIADYNGGPRQARRVMNGESPKAAETVAYLDRVRAYMNRQDQPYVARQAPSEFAERTGRRYALDAEQRPTFEEGTAYPRESIADFYDQHVAKFEKGDKTPMPDVLFQIGRVDDATAAGLRDFLPGFNDGLREARISAQSIKHIHDQRPTITRALLQRLDDGTLYADEVLPNPKDRTRALVVLKNAAPTGESIPKHLSNVLEVSANGTGIDVVTAMSARDSSLQAARGLKEKMLAEKGDTASSGGAAFPSSSLVDAQAHQPHAAADFPTFAGDRGQSIAQPMMSAMDALRLRGTPFDISAELAKVGEFMSGRGLGELPPPEAMTPVFNALMRGVQEIGGNIERFSELMTRYADAAGRPESHGAAPHDLLTGAVDSMRSDPVTSMGAKTSPTMRAAAEAIMERPDLTIRLEDGTDISARDALMHNQADLAIAEADSKGFMAAVTCLLSH